MRLPSSPFVSYADDDTFWELTRVEQALSQIDPANAMRNRIYMGAMQYHGLWNFKTMGVEGWHFRFSQAVDRHDKLFAPSPNETASTKMMQEDRYATRYLPHNATAAMKDAARYLLRPYPMHM